MAVLHSLATSPSLLFCKATISWLLLRKCIDRSLGHSGKEAVSYLMPSLSSLITVFIKDTLHGPCQIMHYLWAKEEPSPRQFADLPARWGFLTLCGVPSLFSMYCRPEHLEVGNSRGGRQEAKQSSVLPWRNKEKQEHVLYPLFSSF